MMSDRDPRTEAGKRLLKAAIAAEADSSTWNTAGYLFITEVMETIAAIEAEAEGETPDPTDAMGYERRRKRLRTTDIAYSQRASGAGRCPDFASPSPSRRPTMSEPRTKAGRRAKRAVHILSDAYFADAATAGRMRRAIDDINPAAIEAEAAPPPLDGLDVERLSVAMNRATVYGKGTAEEVAREYAALREGETPWSSSP